MAVHWLHIAAKDIVSMHFWGIVLLNQFECFVESGLCSKHYDFKKLLTMEFFTTFRGAQSYRCTLHTPFIRVGSPICEICEVCDFVENWIAVEFDCMLQFFQSHTQSGLPAVERVSLKLLR